MNPSSDTGPRPLGEAVPQSRPPSKWREASMALIASRYALIMIEGREAAKEGGRRAGLIAAACGCGLLAWLLLLAGGISLIANQTGWHWNLVAIGAAVSHLVVAIALVFAARPSPGEPFSLTRAEFQKDRQWIENYHGTKKSKG